MNVRARRLTGALPAAVAIVRLEGPEAEALLRRMGAARIPGVRALDRLRLRGAEGEDLDDALLCRVDPETFEVGLHGGDAVVSSFLDAVEALGARIESSEGGGQASLESAAQSAARELASPRAALGLLAAAQGGRR